MERQMNTLRLNRAFKQAAAPDRDRAYETGDKVSVWREVASSSCIGEWLGPFTIENFDT